MLKALLVEVIRERPLRGLTGRNLRAMIGIIAFNLGMEALMTLAAGAGYFDAASYSLASETGGTAEFNASFDPWYLGNILTLSVSGLLWVDPGSGAMWQLEDEVHVVSPAAEAATR